MKSLALSGPGKSEDLGVTIVTAGVVNVAVYSANADRVWFCLFDRRGNREAARVPLARSGDVFHGQVAGVVPGALYGLRADGPYDPRAGHRFDPEKLLVDPYAVTLDRPYRWRPLLSAPRNRATDTAQYVPKAVVTAATAPVVTRRPQIPADKRIVYEVNPRGFTMLHPAVPRALRGTLAGLAHPAAIEHIVRLGVTTVELMPVAAWIDERHLPELGLSNAWGYNPVTFFPLDPRLAPGGIADLQKLIAALHEAGIELLLDVVLNHTGESDEYGATLSLRGIDNATYYRLDPSDPSRYVNDTGCGNTLALDRPAPMRMALDALCHLALAGVDGFRFDLAPVLGRCDDGFRPGAPLLTAIANHPLLKDLVLIAEPWDVGHGGYRLGQFPGTWREWNDHYRDDVRRFWRGDDRTVGPLATRLAGSADIFQASGRGPSASINFVAAHDGFTLNDLVAYSQKHNEANGEGNRDGAEANLSWNRGVEGPVADAVVTAARAADVRALLATLFLSRGTPMLTAGDEMGRSQHGNNNAYAQDNELTWLDWTHADADLIAFVAALIRLRREQPLISADRFLTGTAVGANDIADVAWLDARGAPLSGPAWNDPDRRVLGMALFSGDERILAWFNGSFDASEIVLPPARDGRTWDFVLSSAGPGPTSTDKQRMILPARSVTVLVEV